jgi:dihydrofolate reductase
MRKVTFGGANSLDNYLARPDHAVDWLLWGEEAAAYMADYWKTIDTILMGRKTYEVALRSGQGGGATRDEKLCAFTDARRSPTAVSRSSATPSSSSAT